MTADAELCVMLRRRFGITSTSELVALRWNQCAVGQDLVRQMNTFAGFFDLDFST
ncbi:hypothetical protein RTZ71_28605 [Rhodococcus qingshengii]|uniref:hypothetical protein n=1 Tax=Rhodococcus qingshengii TaxID=334542 RepID=UPI0028F2BDCD|nr:hypothetical protein [Rhodococcus qingshengii]MDT9664681.1 hypothetical protein [Rhodococcus qingshengii]